MILEKALDLSLYLVVHKGLLSFEELSRITLQAVEGGVKIVQLRDKTLSARELVELGLYLSKILKPLGIPLIINDRVDIAHAVGAAGVHLGQSDLNVSHARAILGKSAIIGLSVETLEQALKAQNEDVSYLAASPLFVTKTKSDCKSPWGLEGLKKLCSISSHPVLAIGGINETNVEEVIQCGAQGVAVVSAIFDAPCPKTVAIQLTKRIKKYAV